MLECLQTFDGKHHCQKRHWLLRDSRGRRLDAHFPENWEWVWACVCTLRAPDEIRDELVEAEAESRRIKSARFGQEEHEEPRMEGL